MSERTLTQRLDVVAKWSWVFAAAMLIGGIVIRFCNAGRPVWHDEGLQLLQCRGIGYWETPQILPTAGALAALSEGHPVASLWDTILRLRRDDAQHMPFYTALGWMVGTVWTVSEHSLRYLSATLDVIAIGAVFGIVRETGARRSTALWAAALYAFSPMATQLAYIARDSSTMVAMIMLAIFTFLRAERMGTKRAWLVHYGVVAVGALAHLLFVWCVLGIVIYALVRRQRALILRAAGTAATALAAGSLWYIRVLGGTNGLEWLSTPRPLSVRARAAMHYAALGFVDSYEPGTLEPVVMSVVVVALICIAATGLLKQRQWHWVPLIVLWLEPWGMLFVSDLVHGGMRSLVLRYWALGDASSVLVAPWVALRWPRWGFLGRAWMIAAVVFYLCLGTSYYIGFVRKPVRGDIFTLPTMIRLAADIRSRPGRVVFALPARPNSWYSGNKIILARMVPPETAMRLIASPSDVEDLAAFDVVFASKELSPQLTAAGYELTPAAHDTVRAQKPAKK